MTILRTMRNFSSMNIAASILLFVAAIAAAIIANSPVAPVYQEFLLHELHLQIGNFNLLSHGGENLRMIEFINDGLMTIFFLLVAFFLPQGGASLYCCLWRYAVSGDCLHVNLSSGQCGKSGIGHSNGNGYCFFVRGIKSVGKPCAVEPEDISDGFCGS